MRSDFEVLAGILVDVGPPDDAEPSDLRGQRHRACDPRAGQFGGFHDLGAGLVQHLVVKRLEDDPHLLPCDHNLIR